MKRSAVMKRTVYFDIRDIPAAEMENYLIYQGPYTNLDAGRWEVLAAFVPLSRHEMMIVSRGGALKEIFLENIVNHIIIEHKKLRQRDAVLSVLIPTQGETP